MPAGTMTRAHLVTLVTVALPMCALACSAGNAANPASSSAASTISDAAADAPFDAGPECPVVGPFDASGFRFRSSCLYVIGSDAATLAACDEWSQGGVTDWGAFIDECIGKQGSLSAQPCASAGEVGECVYAPTCTSQLVTFFYGEAGVPSFELACTASVGAAWTPL
jgi:hypothetical protein